MTQPHSPQPSYENAVAAWQSGDVTAARAELERLAAAGSATPQLWLLLAYCCRRLGDVLAEEAALDSLLALEPRNIQALIMKGDRLSAAGNVRGGVSFYERAVVTASAMTGLPQELGGEVQRARRLIEQAHDRFRRSLADLVAGHEQRSGRLGRFAESIDLMLGRRQRYFQQPTGYFFPGLPDSQFYDAARFEWAAGVEAAAGAIRAEYLAAMAAGGVLKPFVATSPDHPPQLTGLANSLDWSAYHLFETGQRVEEHIAACPRTWDAVSRLPIPMLRGVAPSIFFSVLRSRAHIKSHHGVMNTRLVCHLPLIIPRDCGIRVGNDSRTWQEGKLLIFNDAIEHEAWNRSAEPRVVLIFEIWRPELAEPERQAVTELYDAIDAFGGSGPANA